MKKEPQKKWYKKWWIWVIIILVLVAFSNLNNTSSSKSDSSDDSKTSAKSSIDESGSKSRTSINSSSSSSKPDVPSDYKSALRKATSYATTMDMSKAGVYDQLTSDYGEGFSPEASQYAIDNLTDINWNENALAKAKDYQNEMDMSPDSISEQLTSDYGEKFTSDEAAYALQHLSD